MSTSGNPAVTRLATLSGEQDRLLVNREEIPLIIEEIRRRSAGQQCKVSDIAYNSSRVVHIYEEWRQPLPFANEYYVSSPTSTPSFDQTSDFNIQQYGDGVTDPVLRVDISACADTDDDVRFADLFGIRLVDEAWLNVHTRDLDYYNYDIALMRYRFEIPVGKLHAYNSCIGQEDVKFAEGYGRPSRIVGGHDYRQMFPFTDGIQTPKASHVAFTVWIPMLFWTRDLYNMFPSSGITPNDRLVRVKFAKEETVVGRWPKRASVWNTSSNNGGMDYNSAGFAAGALHGTSTYLSTRPRISSATMYFNNIFTLPDISNLIIVNDLIMLTRRYESGRTTIPINTQDNSYTIPNVKRWPCELIYIGFRPTANIEPSLSTLNVHLKNWCKYCSVSYQNNEFGIEDFFVSDNTNLVTAGVFDGPTGDVTKYVPGAGVMSRIIEASTDTTGNAIFYAIPLWGSVEIDTPYVTHIGATSDNGSIYNATVAQFMSTYIPYFYGNDWGEGRPQEDLYEMNFSTTLGQFQPGSYLNLSRNPNFKIEFKSTALPSTTHMIVTARCIQFVKKEQHSITYLYQT